MKRITRDFLLRPTVEVAPDLIGMRITTTVDGQTVSGMIVETEAYTADDPASHSFVGRTRRNDVMFWEGGFCYVYLIYGMHYCVNIVTEDAERGAAVLIRAVEPLDGVEVMRLRRGGVADHLLTSGPARLCQAFGIDLQLQGENLLKSRKITLSRFKTFDRKLIGASPRIGISKGRDAEWRFFLKGNLFLSRRS